MYNRAVKWNSLLLACFAVLGFKKKSEYHLKLHKSPQAHSRAVWAISVGGKTLIWETLLTKPAYVNKVLTKLQLLLV